MKITNDISLQFLVSLGVMIAAISGFAWVLQTKLENAISLLGEHKRNTEEELKSIKSEITQERVNRETAVQDARDRAHELVNQCNTAILTATNSINKTALELAEIKGKLSNSK